MVKFNDNTLNERINSESDLTSKRRNIIIQMKCSNMIIICIWHILSTFMKIGVCSKYGNSTHNSFFNTKII